MSTDKVCHTCKLPQPIDMFYGDSFRPDGREYRCKTCTKQKLKRIYERHKVTNAYKERKRLEEARYRAKYPEKALAHRLAGNNRIKLIKSNCEHCGSAERLHMHHPDYAKPLEVITLCVPCHEAVHHGAPTI